MTMRWNGAEAEAIALAAGMKALTLAAELIKRDSTPLTPKGRRRGRRGGPGGTLRRSYAITPSASEKAVYATYNTPYARRWHEATGNINWSEPGTGSKYLEKPLTDRAADIRRLVTKAQVEALRGRR